MEAQLAEEMKPAGWRALFRTIKNLRLPWVWIVIGLAINLVLSEVALKIPDTTVDLMSGQLNGSALATAVIYYVIYGLTTFLAVVGQVQAQSYAVRKARESVWGKMLGMKMEFFDSNDPSDLMSTITNDVSGAVTGFVNMIIYLIPSVYYVVKAMMKISDYHWILAISCFAMLPVKYFYAWFLGRKYQIKTAQLYGKIGSLTGFLADRITHLPLVKAYTNEEGEGENGKDACKKLYRANMKLVQLDNVTIAMSSTIDVAQKFVVVVVAVILLQKGEITLAMWLGFFLFSQNLFLYMDQIIDSWIRIKNVHGNFQRVIEIMDGDEEEKDLPERFPEDGDIYFKNVSFTYPEGDEPALKNVTLSIKRGTSAAIIGMCGSGKTTTVSLLERLYTPSEGSIFIGDTDVKNVSLSEYRRGFSYVQQGADIFGGTLREALTYGIEREVSDEEIFSAAEKTGFDEYIGLCKCNLDSDVSCGGDSMSGGQVQRLVLTRELLRNGDIIIMDEPTSALDIKVSEKIQKVMDEVFADKTRILITHNLGFARKYDKIFVLKNGELVGEGTHDDSLIKNCDLYRMMYENREEADDE